MFGIGRNNVAQGRSAQAQPQEENAGGLGTMMVRTGRLIKSFFQLSNVSGETREERRQEILCIVKDLSAKSAHQYKIQSKKVDEITEEITEKSKIYYASSPNVRKRLAPDLLDLQENYTLYSDRLTADRMAYSCNKRWINQLEQFAPLATAAPNKQAEYTAEVARFAADLQKQLDELETTKSLLDQNRIQVDSGVPQGDVIKNLETFMEGFLPTSKETSPTAINTVDLNDRIRSAEARLRG